MSTSIPKPPDILDRIVDLVLSHKPKNATDDAAKTKKKRASSKPPAKKHKHYAQDQPN